MPEERQPLVLIADDEPDMVVLLRRLFSRDGFQVEGVADGTTALERAEALKPDLILMDVQMPGLNGFEVLRRLRQNKITAHIPTIFITAAAREPTDVAKGLGLGADDYVLKPFNPHELLARGRSKIHARRLEERLQRRTEELEALVRIGREFNQRLQLDDLLDLIVSVCTTELPSEQVLLCLLDQQTRPTAWRVLDPQEMSEATIQHLIERPDSLVAAMLQTEQSVLSSDSRRVLLPPDCHAIVGTRIVHHGDVLGVLVLGHSQAERYDENHLRLLESITEQAALAIRNAELYAELRHYALNLENMVAERTSALRAAQSQLVRSEKLASLGRLSAGIAHEVNNPLQAIRNCLELAIEDVDSKRPVDRELLTVAEQDVQRIRRIVSRLLDFARPGSGEMTPVDVPELISDVLRLVEPQLAREQVVVSKQIEPTRPVRANEDQLKQVILNLILNAQQAMPGGGRLTIAVSQQGGELHIRFTDTGVGIPESDLGRIFDPFFSTKPDGSGLGLSVSYGIIEGHGGRIEVSSTVGQGRHSS